MPLGLVLATGTPLKKSVIFFCNPETLFVAEIDKVIKRNFGFLLVFRIFLEDFPSPGSCGNRFARDFRIILVNILCHWICPCLWDLYWQLARHFILFGWLIRGDDKAAIFDLHIDDFIGKETRLLKPVAGDGQLWNHFNVTRIFPGNILWLEFKCACHG